MNLDLYSHTHVVVQGKLVYAEPINTVLHSRGHRFHEKIEIYKVDYNH
jgi:hypothetical protein